MKKCRNCTHWRTVGLWQGNCMVHNWDKPKWGSDASAYDCPDFKDKYAKYKVAAKEGK